MTKIIFFVIIYGHGGNMEIEDLVGNEGKIIPQYSYFKEISGNIHKAFGDMDAAIKYAIHTNSLINYLKKVTLYQTEDGRICKGEEFLYIMPNINYKNVVYYIIGEDIDMEEPDFIGFYGLSIIDQEKFNEYVRTHYNLEGKSNIGLYEVRVSVTDDNNSINVEYKLIHKLTKEITR